MTPPPEIVAHVITRLDVGGAQATAVRTCALLDRSRYQPVLLAGINAGSGGSLVADAEAAGVEVVAVPSLVSAVRPHRDLPAVRDLARIFSERSVGLVHTHSSKAGALGRSAARRADLPSVHTVHGWSFHTGQPAPVQALYRSVERRLARWTDAFVVVTGVDRQIGLAAGIGQVDRYHLVRSGIALPSPPGPEDRRHARKVLGWSSDEVGFVAVGRLEPQKDPLTLVDAFAEVVAVRPQARLAVIGDGRGRGAVEARLAERGLTEVVQLLGIRDDVVALLTGADGYVSAARWEGLPRTLVEAVAVGVPAVVTEVGGVGEVVEDGASGWLVGPGRPQALARAMIELVDDLDGARRRADRARHGIEQFDEQAMATSTMEVYDAVLASRRSPR